MGQAYSAAIDKDADATLKAMTVAFDAGFTNFEKLLENEFVEKLHSDSVNSLVEKKLFTYKQKLRKWARESVANFKSFDFKFDVADIDAGRIRNSDFRGRILVLDLWATWCQPCREAIPHFVKLDEEFRGENVDVVGISMDNPDDPGKSLKVVRTFVDQNGVEYAMAMGNRSVMNQLAPEQKLPTVLFIDTEGKVRFIAEGPHNFYQLSAITNELIEQEDDSATSLPRFFGQY
jgi:thiol-disulfide isomerase/thioredoxin